MSRLPRIAQLPPAGSPGLGCRWRLLAALAIAVASGLGAGCSSGVGRPVREVIATPGPDGVQRVRIVAHSYWFEPNRVVVRVGQPVELRIQNGSWIVPHNFTCIFPEAGIEVDEGLGLFKDKETARFTPRVPGEYPFFCNKGSHAKKGMTGTIVVLP